MKTNPREADFLILGQGLAGTCLALLLHLEGHSVHILAHSDQPSASKKAVGLVNPVTGRRMAQTWNFDEIFPYSFHFYQRVFSVLNPGKDGSYLEEKPIFKALHSVEEMNFLTGKSSNLGYDDLLDIRKTDGYPVPVVFDNTVAWCRISKGGRMNPLPFLQDALSYFHQNEIYSEDRFNQSELKREGSHWHYKNIKARTVISCLGMGCPWKADDMWPVKGQVYELDGLPDFGDAILKTEKFLVPGDNGTILAGSTYEREFSHNEIDEAGFNDITQDIKPELHAKMTVRSSWTGIRPTTKDRRPIIEKLEDGLYALNGLGAKGVTLAPWSAEQLIQKMLSERG